MAFNFSCKVQCDFSLPCESWTDCHFYLHTKIISVASASAKLHLTAPGGWIYVYVCLRPTGNNWYLNVSHCRWSQHSRMRTMERWRAGEEKWITTKLYVGVKQDILEKKRGCYGSTRAVDKQRRGGEDAGISNEGWGKKTGWGQQPVLGKIL